MTHLPFKLFFCALFLQPLVHPWTSWIAQWLLNNFTATHGNSNFSAVIIFVPLRGMPKHEMNSAWCNFPRHHYISQLWLQWHCRQFSKSAQNFMTSALQFDTGSILILVLSEHQINISSHWTSTGYPTTGDRQWSLILKQIKNLP